MKICAIAKNEAKYLREWICYHHLIGVRDFTIYDNESTDGTSSLLDSLARFGVKRIPWPTIEDVSIQISAYIDYISNNGSDDSLVAFIDCDEFFSLPDDRRDIDMCIQDIVGSLDDVGSLLINQRVFGSSGNLFYDSSPVVERFTKTAEEKYIENQWFKPICRPSHVAYPLTSHYFELKRGSSYTTDGCMIEVENARRGFSRDVFNGLRLNHYIIKSLEEFRTKQSRGGVASASAAERIKRYEEDFFFGREPNLNKVTKVMPPLLLSDLSALIRETDAVGVV